MNTPTPAPATGPVVSQAEIEAALRTLARAWAPDVALPADPTEVEPREEQCDCGSRGRAIEDYDGEPYCNCNDNCFCNHCTLYRHRRAQVCSAGNVSIGTRCTKPTRYRIWVYYLADQQVHAEEHATYVDAGPEPVTVEHPTACSIFCARQIIARWKESATFYKLPPRYYRIEQWAYVPHRLELSPHLAELSSSAEGVGFWIQQAMTRGGADLDRVREYLARAAWHAHAHQVAGDTAAEVGRG